MFKDFSQLRDCLRDDSPKTLAVAAAHDPHTLEAVYAAAKQLPLRYRLFGDRERILTISGQLGVTPADSDIVECGDDVQSARAAVALIRDGAADILFKGLLETAVLLRAVLDRQTGIRGASTLSHLSVLEVPGYHKLIAVTDAGMLPHPTLEQKAELLRSALSFYSRLGSTRPKVAVLCASETVSDSMPETGDAAQLKVLSEQGELGDCLLEGPISFDLAISREAASIKGYSSEVSGDADILLVPDITTGNALCKALIYWAGARMAGCVLGARVPIVLVSRGASAQEKLLSVQLCLCGS